MTRQLARAYTLADGTIAPSDLPPAMQVWWGDHHGAPLGLMTDSTGGHPLGSDLAALVRLGRAAAVVKCLADERAWAASTHPVEPSALQAAADALVDAEWDTVTIVVDDDPSPSAAVMFAGLDFVVGNADTTAPFVMARPTGDAQAWPPLITVTR